MVPNGARAMASTRSPTTTMHPEIEAAGEGSPRQPHVQGNSQPGCRRARRQSILLSSSRLARARPTTLASIPEMVALCLKVLGWSGSWHRTAGLGRLEDELATGQG